MEATDILKLRVILAYVNAERLILPSRPETENALICEVDKLNVAYDFRLQFQDPEFDNALCNLVNMEGWQNSLYFKMGNYRTKLSRAGINVAVNSGKCSRTNPYGAALPSQLSPWRN